MDTLKILAIGVFFVASFGVLEIMENTGALEKVFGYRFRNVGGIIVFVLIQILPVLLPDLIAVVLAVAMAAGYIGFRAGRSKGGKND